MLARTLLKLLDESIVPAVVLIAAKVLGLALANYLNSIPYSLQPGGGVLPWTVVYSSTAEAGLANTVSNLVMYLVVLAGFSAVLFRAHVLHASHITPKLTARLVRWRLEHFIGQTFDIYHQALVWLSFLWLTTVIIFIYALGGGSVWLTLLTLLLSFTATYLYVKDIEIELKAERIVLGHARNF